MGTILKSSLLNLAATAVSLVAGFLVSVITARLLGPEGSGLTAFAVWFATSLAALSDLGMPQTMLRTLGTAADGGADRADGGERWKVLARTAFALFILPVSTVALATAGYGGWEILAGRPQQGFFWLAAALLFLSYALFTFSTASARGRGRFGETARSTVAGCLLQIPAIVAGAWFFGPAGALAGMALRYLPQALRLGRYVDPRLRPDRTTLTPQMRGYARQMWLTDLLDIIVISRIELAFLGFFFASAEMGYYAVAAIFAGLVGQLVLQLSPALIVGLAGTVEREGMARAQALYGQAARIVALCVFPVGLGGAAIVPQLLPLLYGEAFRPAATAAAMLLAGSTVSGLAIAPWSFLAATGGSRHLLRVMLSAALATMLLLGTAVPLAGLEGAAFARMLLEILTLALLLLFVRAEGGPALPFAALLKTALAAGLSALAALAVTQALPGLGGIGLAILAGAVVYLAAVRLLRLVTAQDAETALAGLAPRLPGRLRGFAEGGIRLIAAPAA